MILELSTMLEDDSQPTKDTVAEEDSENSLVDGDKEDITLPPDDIFDFSDLGYDSPSPTPQPLQPVFETPISSTFSPFSFTDMKLDMMGAGLVNLGNTCFLNAILQCFTHTAPFVQSLRSLDHPTPFNCVGYKNGFCVVCVLREHIELSLGSSGGTVSPYKFVDNLSQLSSSFQRYEQEDAHELLQCLLDKLDQSCSVKVQTSFDHGDSFVKKIFGGCLQSKLQCCNCGHCSDTFEPLIDLSLEIDDVDSLANALKSFTKVEKIEETKFTCENCKEDVSVEKQFTLEQTPSIAALHLKRFKNDGSYVEKIDKYVEYPLELDLQPYSSTKENSNVELKYELYAVVVHTGLSSCSGHYFCFIRSSPQMWHRLDDSKVTRVHEEFVLSQEAYILFYARQGTPWFSTLMEIQKQIDIDSPKSVLNGVETFTETRRPYVASPKSILNGVETFTETRKPCIVVSPKSVINDVDMSSGHSFEGTGSWDTVNTIKEDVERVHTSVPLDEFIDKLGHASEIVDVQPQTPPRSPSPDLYCRDVPEDTYSIPREHLKVKSQTPSNKAANKALEDSKRKEAIRLTRSMPSSRAMKFRACMLGSESESSLNKKKRKLDIGFGRDKSSSGACRKLNPSILKSVATLDF